MIIVLKNYNRFVVMTKDRPKPHWEDFYIHRWKHELENKVVKFSSKKDAEEFVAQHPYLLDQYDVWTVETDPTYWT